MNLKIKSWFSVGERLFLTIGIVTMVLCAVAIIIEASLMGVTIIELITIGFKG